MWLNILIVKLKVAGATGAELGLTSLGATIARIHIVFGGGGRGSIYPIALISLIIAGHFFTVERPMVLFLLQSPY